MGLPTPLYEPEPSDPPWLTYAVQFHGHLGPWATAGLRAGMAGRRAAGAKGYFDVAVTVRGPFVKPPKSCFLDGLQVATGATWGKRNIQYVHGEKVMVRLENTRTGGAVEVRPTEKLLRILASLESGAKAAPSGGSSHEHAAGPGSSVLESLARKIASLPEREILAVRAAGR